MCEHCHNEHNEKNDNTIFLKVGISIVLSVCAYIIHSRALYIFAFLTAGYDIIFDAIKHLLKKNFFDENFLMSIASTGALCIGEYPEAVCVMVLYQIGEYLQDKAVEKSKDSIKELIKIMPEYANIEENGQIIKKNPEKVQINDIVIVKTGEKIPVDGEVIEGSANLDTSSVTGESAGVYVESGAKVLSGCINTDGLIKIKAEKLYKDSTVSKIIELVHNAKHKKSQTENFITRFARIYTPIVVILAVLIAVVPVFCFDKQASIWITRALTFLVISCPCAFVISVPLTFFAGIGRASKSGILIKGSNYIEQLARTSNIAFDKTGTLTKGIFKVVKISPVQGFTNDEISELAVNTEYYSNHPISNAIKSEYKGNINTERITNYTEIAGQGVKILLDNDEILAGNDKLIPDAVKEKSAIYIAKNGHYIGSITVSDTLKTNVKNTITELKRLGIKPVMLTGDTEENAEITAKEAGIDDYFAKLLPQNKVEKLENIMQNAKGTTVFAGDGINDAPVLIRSDVGISMGTLGSDAAIEASDVVIADDNIEKIPLAIKISKRTISIAKQNIIFALLIKVIFLSLGAIGLMTMWGAVFADVGVTLIAVLNSLRTLKMK